MSIEWTEMELRVASDAIALSDGAAPGADPWHDETARRVLEALTGFMTKRVREAVAEALGLAAESLEYKAHRDLMNEDSECDYCSNIVECDLTCHAAAAFTATMMAARSVKDRAARIEAGEQA